jgi:predicted house-cleaning NTP pyrophosphatase (Maf/HAM1 superfamily)
VITAVCIADKNGKKLEFTEQTIVSFGNLSDELIAAYVNTGDGE